jgi:hypothetical protein
VLGGNKKNIEKNSPTEKISIPDQKDLCPQLGSN